MHCQYRTCRQNCFNLPCSQDDPSFKEPISHVQLMETRRKRIFFDKLTYIYLDRKEGLKEGSLRKAEEMARQMKAANESIFKIIAYTGLTEQQIRKL